MNKLIKILLIVVIVLICVGLIIFAVAMIFKHTTADKIEYENVEYEMLEYFDTIRIDTTAADIVFIASDDEKCRVVCYEPQCLKHSVSVMNKVLSVAATDDRKWYERLSLSFDTPKLTIYLPREEYDYLIIDEDVGNIELPSVFNFKNLRIKTNAGDVNCGASSEQLKIELSSGNISLENITAQTIHASVTSGTITVSKATCDGDIWLDVNTGTTKLDNVRCKNLTSDGNTGGINLNDVIVAESLSVVRSTGSIKFENCDANEIFVKTSTGDVRGTLLSEKIFIAQTKTGKLDVPQSTIGGKCEVVTSTGNIEFKINN